MWELADVSHERTSNIFTVKEQRSRSKESRGVNLKLRVTVSFCLSFDIVSGLKFDIWLSSALKSQLGRLSLPHFP